jgi:putative endopeptidase
MKKTIFKTTLITLLALQVNAQNSGLNLADIDKSADPRDGLYQFANGAFLKTAQIPAQESMWGSFNEIIDRNRDNLKKIVEECAADRNAKPGSNKQKIGDLYRTGMDTFKIEKDGFSPLISYLADVNKISNKADLLKTLANFHSQGIPAAFSFGVDADMKNSNDNAVYFSQPELGLADNSYYADSAYKDIRTAYKKHIENMFSLLGDNVNVATKNAETVFAMESKMAAASMGSVDLRDSDKQYNKFSKDAFFKKQNHIDFNLYLSTAAVVKPFTDVIVTQPLYFDKLNQLITDISVAEWKTYLKWCLIHKAAPYLNLAFVKENFSFYSTTLNGVTEMRPRWKRVLYVTNTEITDAVGQLFVEKYFDAESKKKVTEMVDNLSTIFKQRIDSRTWMTEATKKKAHEKLAAMTRQVGYPDKWKDYTTLEIKNDNYISNVFRAEHFGFVYMINKIGKPVDKSEWWLSPQTADAFYSSSKNQLVILAGLMQPPFFNAKADDAFNYGAIGGIIGHEFTHGFDDDGAKYDGLGNLNDWWSQDDKKNFEARTELVRKQYDAYIVVDTFHVNGKLTLGENIADLGGLTMSYYAYKLSLKGKASPVIDGFTGEQRFFIAWAQGWKTLIRPEAAKRRIVTDPHSPWNVRADAPASDLKEFYEAFGVTDKNKMYRPADKRAEVW